MAQIKVLKCLCRRFGLSPPTHIVQADTPKQENSYDCGAYVLGEQIKVL